MFIRAGIQIVFIFIIASILSVFILVVADLSKEITDFSTNNNNRNDKAFIKTSDLDKGSRILYLDKTHYFNESHIYMAPIVDQNIKDHTDKNIYIIDNKHSYVTNQAYELYNIKDNREPDLSNVKSINIMDKKVSYIVDNSSLSQRHKTIESLSKPNQIEHTDYNISILGNSNQKGQLVFYQGKGVIR